MNTPVRQDTTRHGLTVQHEKIQNETCYFVIAKVDRWLAPKKLSEDEIVVTGALMREAVLGSSICSELRRK